MKLKNKTPVETRLAASTHRDQGRRGPKGNKLPITTIPLPITTIPRRGATCKCAPSHRICDNSQSAKRSEKKWKRRGAPLLAAVSQGVGADTSQIDPHLWILGGAADNLPTLKTRNLLIL